MERWFGIITQRAIRRGSFSSVKELIAVARRASACNKSSTSSPTTTRAQLHSAGLRLQIRSWISSNAFAHRFQGRDTSQLLIVKDGEIRSIWPVHLAGWLALGWQLHTLPAEAAPEPEPEPPSEPELEPEPAPEPAPELEPEPEPGAEPAPSQKAAPRSCPNCPALSWLNRQLPRAQPPPATEKPCWHLSHLIFRR